MEPAAGLLSQKCLGGWKAKGPTCRSSSSSRNIDDSSHWSGEHWTFENVKSATIGQDVPAMLVNLMNCASWGTWCEVIGPLSLAGWL